MAEPRIFVFGSNRAGRHGAGAALWARKHRGAVYGVGQGPTGQAFAIPTKDANLRALPLDEVSRHIGAFAEYARGHPNQTFELTPIGCGLANQPPRAIARLLMAANLPENVVLSRYWLEHV